MTAGVCAGVAFGTVGPDGGVAGAAPVAESATPASEGDMLMERPGLRAMIDTGYVPSAPIAWARRRIPVVVRKLRDPRATLSRCVSR